MDEFLKVGKNDNAQCPCCGNYTIFYDPELEVTNDVCEVCYWQYDWVSHSNPTISIGPNRVSFNQARKNYKRFGACEKRLIEYVRLPLPEELIENNE